MTHVAHLLFFMRVRILDARRLGPDIDQLMLWLGAGNIMSRLMSLLPTALMLPAPSRKHLILVPVLC